MGSPTTRVGAQPFWTGSGIDSIPLPYPCGVSPGYLQGVFDLHNPVRQGELTHLDILYIGDERRGVVDVKERHGRHFIEPPMSFQDQDSIASDEEVARAVPEQWLVALA